MGRGVLTLRLHLHAGTGGEEGGSGAQEGEASDGGQRAHLVIYKGWWWGEVGLGKKGGEDRKRDKVLRIFAWSI